MEFKNLKIGKGKIKKSKHFLEYEKNIFKKAI